MSRLLIAVDGSEHAHHAIQTAARLAQEAGPMEVLLVHVTGLSCMQVDPATLVEPLQTDAVRHHQWQVLKKAAHRACPRGLVDCSTEATSRMVAQSIVQTATEAGVDQIVMGTRGPKARRNHFLDSVAQQVLQLAPMPVLLVT